MFADADRDHLTRYLDDRHEDLDNPVEPDPVRRRSPPLGAGAQFAMMQLKVILSVLLKDWTFELGQPADSYVNDHSKMVVQMNRPTTVKYHRRTPVEGAR